MHRKHALPYAAGSSILLALIGLAALGGTVYLRRLPLVEGSTWGIVGPLATTVLALAAVLLCAGAALTAGLDSRGVAYRVVAVPALLGAAAVAALLTVAAASVTSWF